MDKLQSQPSAPSIADIDLTPNLHICSNISFGKKRLIIDYLDTSKVQVVHYSDIQLVQHFKSKDTGERTVCLTLRDFPDVWIRINDDTTSNMKPTVSITNIIQQIYSRMLDEQ